jgi:hypothetical protein
LWECSNRGDRGRTGNSTVAAMGGGGGARSGGASVCRGQGPAPLLKRPAQLPRGQWTDGEEASGGARPDDSEGPPVRRGGRTAAQNSRRSRCPRCREACSGLGRARPASGTCTGGPRRRGSGGPWCYYESFGQHRGGGSARSPLPDASKP